MINRKSTGVLVVLALLCLVLALFSGCTTTQSDAASLKQLFDLQDKFGVKENFSTNSSIMNNYISQLSIIRGKSAGSAAKIIDGELYSAQAFYYLNKAISVSSTINFQTFSCSSKEVKDTTTFTALAQDYSAKAVAALTALNSNELSNLRVNQLETVQNYQTTITQINSFLKEKC